MKLLAKFLYFGEQQGEEVKIGCRMIDRSTNEKAQEISVYNLASNPAADWDTTLCATERKLSCWHNFTLVQPVIIICLWDYNLYLKQTLLSLAQQPYHSPLNIYSDYKRQENYPLTFEKLDPMPSNILARNKCYLIYHGPLNKWNYQCR